MNVVTKKFEQLEVCVFPTRDEMGKAAAEAVGKRMVELIAQQGSARVVFASAASQNEFLEHLCQFPGIDWSKVTAFHQDEWVGVPMDKEYSFAGFIKKYLFDRVRPGAAHYIDGMADMDAECKRYAALLCEKPLDIICLGIGENGHIAFNEPHEADFRDPVILKRITLDEKCRLQQKNDFGFASVDDVPKYGITITIPVIMNAGYLCTVVPGPRKAAAVQAALTDAVSEKCPATILRKIKNATLFLDTQSAQLVPELVENM